MVSRNIHTKANSQLLREISYRILIRARQRRKFHPTNTTDQSKGSAMLLHGGSRQTQQIPDDRTEKLTIETEQDEYQMNDDISYL